MLSTPERPEIDHRTIKLTVGVVALSLAALTSLFARTAIASISAAYYEGGTAQSILVGFLFAASALLLAYNGYSVPDMVLSKIASLAGLAVALFPCKCGTHVERFPGVHDFAAAVMFVILAYFCYSFIKRARTKGYPQAKLRIKIYAVCGIAILLVIVVLGIDRLTHDALTKQFSRLTFYGEAVGLIAFGISWLTASRVLPLITHPDERFSPLRAQNPD
jgi:hypothetical protein